MANRAQMNLCIYNQWIFDKGARNTQRGEKTVSLIYGGGKTRNQFAKKNELGPLSDTTHKTQLEINIKFEMVKLVEENRGEMLLDIGLSNNFLNDN